MKNIIKDFIKDFFYMKSLVIAFIVSLLCYLLFKDTNQYLKDISMMVMGTTGFALLISFFVILMICIFGLFGSIVGLSQRKIKQLDKSDFRLDKEYYREILKINSPLVIGYMDNLEINKNKLIAELLYLKMRNLIKVEEEQINKVINDDYVYILKSEKTILDSIYNNRLRISNYDSFMTNLKNQVICEAEHLSLVKNLENAPQKSFYNQKGLKILYGIMFALTIIVCIISIIDPKFQNILGEILSLSLAIIVLFIGIWVIISLIKVGHRQGKGKIYKRTQKGQEINQKLEGLKNYLKDYSLMDEREAKELELWDEYLIYSVMFGHNKKIIEEYEKYIEIEK